MSGGVASSLQNPHLSECRHLHRSACSSTRWTCFPISVVVDRTIRCEWARFTCAKDENGYRHRKVVQCPKGLRVYPTRRRIKGRVCSCFCGRALRDGQSP